MGTPKSRVVWATPHLFRCTRIAPPLSTTSAQPQEVSKKKLFQYQEITEVENGMYKTLKPQTRRTTTSLFYTIFKIIREEASHH